MKDGGKYAFLGMESREAGDAVIKALNLQVPFDRDDELEVHDKHDCHQDSAVADRGRKLYLHMILHMAPPSIPHLTLSLLGGEGERDHCEVERGGYVDLPRPLLWEKQL